MLLAESIMLTVLVGGTIFLVFISIMEDIQKKQGAH